MPLTVSNINDWAAFPCVSVHHNVPKVEILFDPLVFPVPAFPTLVSLPEPVVELGPELPPVCRVPAPRVRSPPHRHLSRNLGGAFPEFGDKLAQKWEASLCAQLWFLVRQIIYFLSAHSVAIYSRYYFLHMCNKRFEIGFQISNISLRVWGKFVDNV